MSQVFLKMTRSIKGVGDVYSFSAIGKVGVGSRVLCDSAEAARIIADFPDSFEIVQLGSTDVKTGMVSQSLVDHPQMSSRDVEFVVGERRRGRPRKER